MKTGTELVLHFWNNVWSHPYDLDLIDELMTEDFTITNAGKDIQGREHFKAWIKGFQEKIKNGRLENTEIFENADGTRVVSRWTFSGYNNGIFDLPPDGRFISFTGIAVWEIRDNKLAHNWVERSAYELYRELTA
jgi:predicted ester cyclase